MNIKEIKKELEECEVEYERLKIQRIRLSSSLMEVESKMEEFQNKIENLKDTLEQKKIEENFELLHKFLERVNGGEFNKGNVIVKGKNFNVNEETFVDNFPLVVFTIVNIEGTPIVRSFRINLKRHTKESMEKRLREEVEKFVKNNLKQKED